MEPAPVRSQICHSIFWWSGILMALAPYLILNINPEWRAPWILDPGHFADNVVVAARHVLIGATLGGWLWYLVSRQRPLTLAKGWWKTPTSLNWVWFAISFVIYSIHNILLLFPLPFGTGELIAACLGRIFTAFIVLSLLWFITHIASLAAPKRFRLLPWFIPAMLPGFIGADALGIIFWKNSLRFFVNKIDEEGTINLARQLSAGGFHYSTWEIVSLLLLVAGILSALCFFSSQLSRKISPRFGLRPQVAIFVLSGIWIGLAAEKASGFVWKSRKALRMEHNSYEVHLTPIKPSPGVASFSASWKPAILPEGLQPPTTNTTTATSKSDRETDIFFIMIESTRQDLLQPEHAPFLCQFRDEEAQALGKTWAASNATHLSWFSIFNGQIPPYWGDAMSQVRQKKQIAPSLFIQALKQKGYRLEARTVCDLAYNAMGPTNFGLPHGMRVLTQANPGSPLADLTIPEREIEIFKQAKQSLLTSPSSGNFHFIALDSPHFGYDWHPEFTPPYEEYDESAMFHAYPTPNDIQRVKNRHLNAVAWADFQIGNFIDFLKEQDRYDDALIIITSDHGEEFHEHGSWFHCSSLEQEQTRVPLLIKWPQNVSAPAQKSASHLDLLPTLLDYLDQPEESYAHLPGQSLLRPRSEESTQITITSFCGITGIAMAWERNGYRATFRWSNPWATKLPDILHLDDITNAEGSLNLTTPEEWETALRTHFPDTPSRFFFQFERRAQ